MIKKCKKRRTRSRNPTLRFTPYAWAKLLYLRDLGPTEVGGFGICPTDPLVVEDFQLIKQRCTPTFVAFDDMAVADYFDTCVESGLQPSKFARVWIHTHPGQSALPSCTDENTFSRVFGKSDWAVMFILAKAGTTYARIRFGESPCLESRLRFSVDYSLGFPGSMVDAWALEYADKVIEEDGFAVQDWYPFQHFTPRIDDFTKLRGRKNNSNDRAFGNEWNIDDQPL